ncbi:NUDIX hydrolase [Aquirufa aurantiipilula]|uniref:NUDIX domain-containing protein n=1 Tax=Aquirufa aurantiipilula TaxID=2696561 RepID=A0ABT6BKH3_9BACT|nr:NUDIX domain-containing protein [Aquirufa aurantiipilula]MDF5690449.1 NUDIX domain-containing protein [Aquirufa aurantiipilula]
MAKEYSVVNWLPHISVDCVIFGFHENQLKVLLLKFKNTDVWSVSGGFVKSDEDMDQAASRVLFERTGLKDIYLEQFYTFGDVKRNQGAIQQHAQIQEKIGESGVDTSFLSDRYISIGYYALVDFSKVKVNLDQMSDVFSWNDIYDIPTMFLDHRAIIDKALERLRWSLDQKLLAFNLLAETFTMSELQQVYETILGKKLVRTNFQRKILSMDILVRLEKRYLGGAHKAPYLYRFDAKKAKVYLSQVEY